MGPPVRQLRGQLHHKTANDPGWRAAAEAYLQGLADSGDFPNLAAFGAADLLHSEYHELTFDTGLNWLLTGIAADAQSPTQQPPADRTSPASAETPVQPGI
jgi:hypothetical protein